MGERGGAALEYRYFWLQSCTEDYSDAVPDNLGTVKGCQSGGFTGNETQLKILSSCAAQIGPSIPRVLG